MTTPIDIQTLDFDYPEELVATEPRRPSRVMLSKTDRSFQEVSVDSVIDMITEKDVLVVNNSKVAPRRVMGQDLAGETFEVLFANKISDERWEVLCPASRMKGDQLTFPDGIKGKIVQRGRPQIMELNEMIGEKYFWKHGEMPLPPYIRRSRGEIKLTEEDKTWYQSIWAREEGSSAAPTASLHFNDSHLNLLKTRGIPVLEVTLHIGLGTFLPIDTQDVTQFHIHTEEVIVSESVQKRIEETKSNGGRVFALGTTAVRTIESLAVGKLEKYGDTFRGNTDLFIYPGFNFKLVDVMLTNFHQPKTTLIAMLQAFAGVDRVKAGYRFAIENKFRLFSYGDLSVWEREQ